MVTKFSNEVKPQKESRTFNIIDDYLYGKAQKTLQVTSMTNESLFDEWRSQDKQYI